MGANDKLIICAALTGALFQKVDNPNLPTTPDEIAADARRCADEGASIFHLHARDHHENASSNAYYFKPIIQAVWHQVPGAIICVSCSGRHNQTLPERAEVLNLSGIDMASLTLGSMNFPTGASVNDPFTIRQLARKMQYLGIVPELECFELGHVHYSYYLADQGVLNRPLWFNFFLGNQGTLPANKQYLVNMADIIPEDALWAGAGVGRYQADAVGWAISLGGHVRTGLEDGLRDKHGNLTINPALVQQAAIWGRMVGREPATTEEARAMIWGELSTNDRREENT